MNKQILIPMEDREAEDCARFVEVATERGVACTQTEAWAALKWYFGGMAANWMDTTDDRINAILNQLTTEIE